MKTFVVVIAALAIPLSAGAQPCPSRPITLVVPYTPGTGLDIIARTVGPNISERWGQPVVVDNKPGASGNISAALVARAAPDGYTLMVTVNTFTITQGMVPAHSSPEDLTRQIAADVQRWKKFIAETGIKAD